MSALEKIVKWASTLPAWQDDIIRRLLTQSAFSESDEEEIIKFIKKDYGLIEDKLDTENPQRIERINISGVHQTGVTIKLISMKCISGVNAIPENSEIPFSAIGLNAVYGDNGSGKSGYARILKKACRARDNEEDILNNVFDDKDYKVRAEITINTENQDKKLQWEMGEEAKDELSNISVFDAKCARVILDKKNNAQYLPYGTHIFEELVAIIKDIKHKLEIEIPIPRKPELDEIDLNTIAGKFYNYLDINTKDEDVENISNWTEEDDKKLQKIKKDILNLEVNDPIEKSKKLKILQERLEEFALYVIERRKILSNSEFLIIKNNLEAFTTAEKALEEISKLSLSNEPLEGAGSNVWQVLYNAAKKYSIEIAYPGKEFPYLETDSLCVLCMQPIKELEVKLRFERFKKFMEDTTKKDLENIEEKLKSLRISIKELQFHEESFSDVFKELSVENQDLTDTIKEYFSSLKTRKENIINILESKKFSPLTEIDNFPKRELYNYYNSIKKEIKELEESAVPEKKDKMKLELSELESLQLLSKSKKDIKKYIADLKIERKYKNCINDIKTRNITIKGRDIISEALSPQLTQTLSDELSYIGGKRLPVFFKVTGGEGITEHQLHLKGIKKNYNSLLGEILSEGEQKAIAIAGFLAELKTSNQNNPIVLDDPVSSLDHRFRRNVAKRLIMESKERQVIVFTHDLPFLMMLQEFAEKEECAISIKSIERTITTPGICTDYMPWDAMKVKERIKILKEKHLELKDNFNQTLESEYQEKAASLYGKLRETWERLVEELLLNGVVYRFGRDIQTKRLERILDIKEKDYNIVYDSIEKCSKYFVGHDKSVELHESLPEPDEILEDIKELEEYSKELKNRKRSSRN